MSLSRQERNREWMRQNRQRNYDKVRAGERASQAKRKARLGEDAVRAYNKDGNLKYFFGINLLQYEGMLSAQGGVCGICNGPPNHKKGYHVDHDHETGLIRGVICHTCNQAMVAFDRVPDWGAKAAAYVERAQRVGIQGRFRSR